MFHARSALTVLVVGVLWPSVPAVAQTIGTFSWQQRPYCNVLTLTVVQSGPSYLLNGFDDLCGAARRGSVVGVAFPNPNGTIGLGLTVVTNTGGPGGGAPLHLDITVSLASLSGTWNDSAGSSGTWAFAPGGSTGGPPRPVGSIGTVALAPGAVTSDKLAASAFAGTGSATTVARSDHDHAGSVFAGLVGMAFVGGDGTLVRRTPGTTLTVSRSGTGNYFVTLPGAVAGPGCDTNTKLVLGVVTPHLEDVTVSTNSQSRCPSGDLDVVVRTRRNGVAVNSSFDIIVFLGQ